MSDTMDPFVWTEPAPLPDPTLVDFFTSPLPEPPPPKDISAETPSNSTHAWESELATLQQQNTALQEKLADVPRLLEQLDHQKAELTAARRRLATVETDRVRLQDRVERLERVAKRPRVEAPCCTCGQLQARKCQLSEWLDGFALTDVPDSAPEVHAFVAIIDDTRLEQKSEEIINAVFNCLIYADEERSLRILQRIAASSLTESVKIPALVDGILAELKSAFQQTDTKPEKLKDVVRLLLQGAVAGIWTKRTAAEVLATFLASRHRATCLLRQVFSSNRESVKEVLVKNTDGRDLNVVWGRSLQAAVTYYTVIPNKTEPSARFLCDDAMVSRWNEVRTTVEDLEDHASLGDAETGLLLEWSMRPIESVFEVTVRKALLEKVDEMAKQAEKQTGKMKKMLGLIEVLMCALTKDETAVAQKCIKRVATWLISLACREDVDGGLSVTAVNMSVDEMARHGGEFMEDKELKEGLTRFSRRNIDEEEKKLLSNTSMKLLKKQTT